MPDDNIKIPLYLPGGLSSVAYVSLRISQNWQEEKMNTRG
jgi:hypothetical protein